MKQVIGIIIALVIASSTFAQKPTEQELKKNIDQLLKGYAHYQRFAGNVLVSNGKKIIYQRSFGYANTVKQQKHTSKSIFDVASISKPLTAVGVMTLVENGKLKLDDPISSYLPNFLPSYSPQITIKHLLNHSSGMQANIAQMDESGQGLVMPTTEALSLKIICEKFKDSELKFEPGTAYEYNNLGYVLLAHIIEQASGQDYVHYMNEAVFLPAGMKQTAFAKFKQDKYSTTGHLGLGSHDFSPYTDTFHPSWLMGAGGIYTSTEDLLHFMEALETGKLLNTKTAKQLYEQSQSMQVNEMAYGLGWVIDKRGDDLWYSHDGSYIGYSAMMGNLPNQNMKIILLSNATATDFDTDFQGNQSFTQEITEKIISLIQGKKVRFLDLPITKTDVNNIEQNYQLDPKHSFSIKKETETYWLETNNWSVFTYAFSKDANDNSQASKIALNFAQAMESQKLEGLAAYANEEMQGFLGSDAGLGQLKGMWGYFLNEAGAFKSANIYKIAGEKGQNVHIRFHFETKDVGIVLSFNQENKIQGLFMDDAVKTSHISKVVLIPVGKNRFFINGYQYGGMQDLYLIMKDDRMLIQDGEQEFEVSMHK